MNFVVEHLPARTELDGAAPGFVVCAAGGIASVQSVGPVPAYLVDTTNYAVTVL